MAFTIVGVSLFLLTVTPLSYALNDRGPLSLVLFWLGLGGERNVGAWWSGMLFLLAAIFALDRTADAQRTPAERRGWASLVAALLLLSFDEVAGLHEFLSARSQAYLLPVAMLGLAVVVYSLVQLRRAAVRLHALLLAFGLLATVPLQEFVQLTREWPSPVIYGARALLEEGTEIFGALLLVAATSGGLLRLRMAPQTFASVVWLGTPLLWLAVIAVPIAALAVYPIYLPGAANWLAATLFFSCALLALRRAAGRHELAVLAAVALYLLASLGSNAVRPDWDPMVLGVQVNLRGIYFGSLLLAAPWVLSAGQSWRQRAFWLALAGCTLLGAFVLLRPQVVWSTWPPTIALLCFYIEISAAMRARAAVARERAVATVESAPAPRKAPTIAGPL